MLCLFVPKIYAVMFVDEDDIKIKKMTNSTAQSFAGGTLTTDAGENKIHPST